MPLPAEVRQCREKRGKRCPSDGAAGC